MTEDRTKTTAPPPCATESRPEDGQGLEGRVRGALLAIRARAADPVHSGAGGSAEAWGYRVAADIIEGALLPADPPTGGEPGDVLTQLRDLGKMLQRMPIMLSQHEIGTRILSILSEATGEKGQGESE